MNIEVYQRTHAGTSGSTNCVGGRFRSFEISNLEMVDQMCVSWNPLRSWLCQLDGLRRTDFVRQESTSLLTLEQDKIAEGLLSTENE